MPLRLSGAFLSLSPSFIVSYVYSTPFLLLYLLPIICITQFHLCHFACQVSYSLLAGDAGDEGGAGAGCDAGAGSGAGAVARSQLLEAVLVLQMALVLEVVLELVLKLVQEAMLVLDPGGGAESQDLVHVLQRN